MTEEAGKEEMVTRSGSAALKDCSMLKLCFLQAPMSFRDTTASNPQLVVSGICRPVTAREISPACDLQLFRTESSIYVQEDEKEDLLTSCCLSRI